MASTTPLATPAAVVSATATAISAASTVAVSSETAETDPEFATASASVRGATRNDEDDDASASATIASPTRTQPTILPDGRKVWPGDPGPLPEDGAVGGIPGDAPPSTSPLPVPEPAPVATGSARPFDPGTARWVKPLGKPGSEPGLPASGSAMPRLGSDAEVLLPLPEVPLATGSAGYEVPLATGLPRPPQAPMATVASLTTEPPVDDETDAASGTANASGTRSARGRGKKGGKETDVEDPALIKAQHERNKSEIMAFLRETPTREPGERWLFLAKYCADLDDPDGARELLRRVVRAVPVAAERKWEAQLLLAEILEKQKMYAEALKELERLLSWQPQRQYKVRAELARARLFSRDLTHFSDLLKAYRRYHAWFPDANEPEELVYFSGFEKGYNLEIAIHAIEAWEKIASFPELPAANEARLQLAIIEGYDLGRARQALTLLSRIGPPYKDAAEIRSLLVRGAIQHLHIQPPADPKVALAAYREYLARETDIDGWRTGQMLLGDLLRDRLNDPREAVDVFLGLTQIPPHLATESLRSLKRARERADDDRAWALLGYKMAGHCAEFNAHDLDRALMTYRQGIELARATVASGTKDDGTVFWFETAIARTEPKTSKAQALFDQAVERYRSRDLEGGVRLFDQFVASHPDHLLRREAMFRAVQIVDDDLHRFDDALARYQRYLIEVSPRKSKWQLDAIYDWGRADEARYRIGNLLARHRSEFVKALKTFADLSAAYPDSFWAKQGVVDSIEIYQKRLDDENRAREFMRQYIDRWPNDKKSQDYRRYLAKALIAQGLAGQAMGLLQDLIDHGSPTDKESVATRQLLRDLSFSQQKDRLQAMLGAAGNRDRPLLYANLIDILTLATSTAALDELGRQIRQADNLNDATRWGLMYRLGTRLYAMDPSKSREVFAELAASASGTTRLKCLLTLGNIAYRVEKNQAEAIKAYEAALAMAPLDPLLETPTYRLGRLYACRGEGVLAITTLNQFIQRFPLSRHLAKAYLARGQIELALHRPDLAERSVRRALTLDPPLAEKAKDLVTQIEKAMPVDRWLAARRRTLEARQLEQHDVFMASLTLAMTATGTSRVPVPGWREPEQLRARAALLSGHVGSETGSAAGDERSGATASGAELLDVETLSPTEIYQRFQAEAIKAKPAPQVGAELLLTLLRRSPREQPQLWQKALRQYISWRLWRRPDQAAFVKEVAALLERHNYSEDVAELAYRHGAVLDRVLQRFEQANKSYFQYLSFYPKGARVKLVRARIPQVYEELNDTKSAKRFYQKVVDDPQMGDELRVDASVRLGRMMAKSDGESGRADIQKLLESALALDTPRRPELYLRLEKLTSNQEYVERALEAKGAEPFRLLALKRLVKKAEEKDFDKALELVEKYKSSFSEDDSVIWLDKKLSDLAKRGQISKIEDQIEQFPEEAQTPQRIFQLANLIEGLENTRYRSQDLFYEITLVYPHSQYYRESKIRAENTRAIEAVHALSAALKKGVQGADGDSLLLERARIYATKLQDDSKAQEDCEAVLTLFPNSPRRWEAMRGLGDAILRAERNAERALRYYEQALAACPDAEERGKLTAKVDALVEFRDKVLVADGDVKAQQTGLDHILAVWRLDLEPERALALIQQARTVLENKPLAARLWYLEGRLLEQSGKKAAALLAYRNVVDSIANPGARKDVAWYRMMRLHLEAGDRSAAEKDAIALTTRYPRSLMARSAWYRLACWREEAKDLSGAHAALDRLLSYRALIPTHRTHLTKKQADIEARMNLEDLDRLRAASKVQNNFRYLAARLLENDQRDSERAMAEYQAYLATRPGVARSREILMKLATMAERKGDYAAAIGYLDQLMGTREPCAENLDLVTRIGGLLEDKVNNPELTTLFFQTVADVHRQVPQVRRFALSKIKRMEEKARVKVAGPVRRKVKREYTEEDKELLTEIDDILGKYVDDQADFVRAERELLDMWDANPKSEAVVDIMKELVALNEERLLDPGKATEYYERFLKERPDDPEVEALTLKLYELYSTKLQNGEKALQVLSDFERKFPNSTMLLEIQLKLGKANETLTRNYSEARRIYQRIIDTQKNDPIVHETYFRMGTLLRDGFADYNGAIAMWQSMNTKFYQNAFAAEAVYEIGLTYEVYLRDFTKAKDAFNSILRQWPNTPLQNKVREAILRVGG